MGKSKERVLSALMVALAASLVSVGCTQYKQKIASQDSEIQKLQAENQKLKDEKGDAEAKLAALDIEKKACDDGSQSLQAKIDELQNQITGSSAKIDELEAQLDALGTGKDKLAKNLADKEAMLKELQKEKMQAKKRLEILKNMLGKFQKLIQSGKLNVKIRNGKMVLELPSAILFESGKADLSEEGKKTLEEVAGVLAQIKNREFQVAGHTDTDPIKSSGFGSNWELSAARAVSVVMYLEKNKVNPKTLSAAGYSEFQPTASNKSDQGKQSNRRIEITLMPNLDELPDLSDLEKELKK